MTHENAPLPIDDVLDAIAAGLSDGNRLVVSAPPGAGKTTRVPLKLASVEWAKGRKLILVQPRRIAARAAAERMASTLGEKVGQTIGLRTRMDVRTSAKAAIEVVTEGVFTRQILSDQALEGVAGVIFDEFHERSLDADEGMAFALQTQDVLRPDLRLVVMSATLPENLTTSYFNAPVIHSDGRMHAVETHYLGSSTSSRIEDQVAAAIEQALRDQGGSILAFLPGAAEIRRTIDRLGEPPAGVSWRPLYGALSPAEQSAAIAPTPEGERKVVVATDIAESAITIDGVRVVIDSGFARVPRFDPLIGATRLETVRIARANADQRRGRAGRTQPGVCYRLWREAEMGGFAQSPTPEIENADLSGLCLDLARWGVRDADELQWLDPPPRGRLAAARDALTRLGAFDDDGELTPTGARLANLPLQPALAMLVVGAAPGEAALDAALVAALLSERDLGGRSTDLSARLENLRTAQSPRERKMRQQASRWAQHARGEAGAAEDVGARLTSVMPQRIARARPNAPGQYLMAGGRGAFVEASDHISRHEWLVAADVIGGGPNLRITLAAPLDRADLERLGLLEVEETALLDRPDGKVRARRRTRLGAIVVEETPLPRPPPTIIRQAYVDAIRDTGLEVLSAFDALEDYLNRIETLRRVLGDPWPAEFAIKLRERADEWLPSPEGSAGANPFPPSLLIPAVQTLLPWPMPREVDTLAPRNWSTPAGTTAQIDYDDPDAPVVACQIQQVFGLTAHPCIAAGRIPLTFHLLSPARRPIAVTRDIGSFWTGGYADARKDMKARYPKHFWPEDPDSERARARSIRPSGDR